MAVNKERMKQLFCAFTQIRENSPFAASSTKVSLPVRPHCFSLSMNRLLLLLLLCFGQPLFAQRKPIEIDTLTGLPSEHLPFDSPFELKIPVSSDRIHSLSYAKVKSSRADKPLRLGKIFTLTPPLVKTPVPVAGKKYVIAVCRQVKVDRCG